FRTRLGDGFVFASQGILRQYECSSLEELNRLYGNTDKRWPKPGDYEKYLEEIRRKKQFLGHEVETRLVSGRTEWHLLYAYLDEDDCHVNGFIVDITEQRRLREQLNQSQKIEAVGQLAGGVAHDFNNSLAGIIGAAELLREGAMSAQDSRHYIDMILSTAERAGQLTKKLLAFSRKAAKTSTVVDVGAIVNDTSAILRRTIDKRIEIVVENRASSAQVVGDDALLQNAFLNMGINAGYAMPEGGRLTFTLEDTVLDEAYCSRSAFELEPGDYLEIAVEDTGCGMSQETLQRIFEPFFTTREQGKGTGLGLSAVYGTVQDHHGAILVYSEPGRGSVFHIYLPLAADGKPAVAADAPIEQGSGTLLVIDDEELIRVTAKAMLERLGYTVLTAGNGAEGLEVLVDQKDRIQLVILDMIMPVMSGKDTFRGIRALDRTLPVIICSGFSKEGELTWMREDPFVQFLRKPFRLAELANGVAEALKAARPGGVSGPPRP
ncbi:MAG TPA: ATP-binding protein, partial [Holophaga sp.]|nr:ATP-binding protein [Holophaga sp.]